MARLLFTTWEGGGHVQPLLLCALGLQQRGHQVLVVSDPCNGSDAAALGLSFRSWTTAPSRPDKTRASDLLKDWEDQTPLESIHRICDRLIAGPADGYADDVLAILREFAADLIVTQELLFGVIAAAEAKAIPCALFCANIWPFATLDGQPPFGAGLAPAENAQDSRLHKMISDTSRMIYQHGLPALNRARTVLGLAPLDDLFHQLQTPGAILLATSRRFDFAPEVLPDRFHYVGPYLADPAWAAPWTSPWPKDNTDPLVLVSFSSLYQAQETALSRVIEALADRPVRVLVTLGPALDPNTFPAPPNVQIVQSAAHSVLLKDAALMITHAGHGTALRALMAGVPLVCLPFGRDQTDNATRIALRGAGLKLTADATTTAVRAAVESVLSEPRYRQAAAALGQAIAADTADRSAETEIERLLSLG